MRLPLKIASFPDPTSLNCTLAVPPDERSKAGSTRSNTTATAEASDGAQAYRLFKDVRPDLVIMDMTMPGIGGIETIRRIRQWDRGARILVFTMHQNAGFAVQAIRAGARGYVTKTSPPDALVRAVMDVLAGRIAVSPDIDHELALSRLGGETIAADVLSAREFEVLQLLLAENTTEEIADALHISPKTVANLHSAIKDKLGVGSDIELVRLALRQGILTQADAGKASP